VFVVGHLRGTPRPKIFPIGKLNLKVDTEKRIKKTVLTRKRYEKKLADWRVRHFKGDHSAHVKKEIPELYFEDGRIQTREKDIELTDEDLKHYLIDNRTRYGNHFITEGDLANCLMGANAVTDLSFLIKDGNIRKLTPRECERLQGLPEDFTKFYDDGSLVPDNERYERVGRTVSIPIIKAMGERLGKEFY
jgi:site-specific DNA-cytosine methylase